MKYNNYHRDKTYLEEEGHFKNIFQKRYNLVKDLTPGKILEVGSSTGTMLDIFKKNGWETFGVEPSESAKIAKKKGHKIINDYFEKVALKKNNFDLIVMNHVLEHMDNPEKVLKKTHTLLKERGVLLVDVPNAGGLAARLLGDNWPYRLPLEHKHQFTRESLSILFKKAGLKVTHFESRSGIFEFANPIKEIFGSLIRLKKRFFTDLLNIPYDILVTALNMGDSMTIIGKRI